MKKSPKTESFVQQQNSQRQDIQILRGIAVLSVVLYHAKFEFLKSGFLGVDIFFVISGYLITGLISRAISRNNFSFVDFYTRRAKRLLPSAYLTLLATILLSQLLLTGDVFKDLIAQVIGTLTFTANIVLWKQSGYFGGAAELKPLLHMWSLAIEEQYYMLIPLILVLAKQRWQRAVLILIFFTSLFACFYLSGRTGTFYLLPTRAWELAIGSIGALLTLNKAVISKLDKLAPVLVLACIGLLFVKPTGGHPDHQALAICLISLSLLLANSSFLKNPVFKPLSKTGDISYSLYLVHWPLFAIYNNAWLGDAQSSAPLLHRSLLVILSFALALALNKYIEEPFRHKNTKSLRVLIYSTGAAVLLIALAYLAAYARSQNDIKYEQIRRPNHGLGEKCIFTKELDAERCLTPASQAKILLWGDSFAMHLGSGLSLANPEKPILQATSPNCGPLKDIAVIQPQNGRDEKWAMDCIKFNESVFKYIKSNNIRQIVISSPLDYYLDENTTLLKKEEDGSFSKIKGGLQSTIGALNASIQEANRLNIPVTLVTPPPNSGFDIGRCLERLERDIPILGNTTKCTISSESYLKHNEKIFSVLNEIRSQGNVQVVSFDEFLCEGGECKSTIDNKILYRDTGHLTYEGSNLIIPKLEKLHF